MKTLLGSLIFTAGLTLCMLVAFNVIRQRQEAEIRLGEQRKYFEALAEAQALDDGSKNETIEVY